jgi:hypothetical protein
MRRNTHRGLRWLATSVVMLAAVTGCNARETLLEARDPDIINPADVDSPDGAEALRIGTLGRFANITAGSESTWLFGGLLADEWATSSTFVQNDETDERQIKLDNSSITGQLRALYRVRLSANQTIAALKKYTPSAGANIAEMYLARGFAELQLASDFCNGIPLSDASTNDITYGSPLTIDAVFAIAVASFDSGLAIVGTDQTIGNALKVAKARALLGLNKIAEAGALVTSVPTSFAYNHTFALTSGTNTIWGQNPSSRRYNVGDSLEGNSRNLLVKNNLPFFSANDPRVPATYTVGISKGKPDTTRSQDGQTFSRTTTLYDQETPIAVTNGIDARLIEAEAKLKAGDSAGMLALLNALRASPQVIGTVKTPVMAPLADPGTAAARLDLLFREKAFWTFARGQRLGDMRRLIRQYSRTADQVFPIGVHYRGGNYGGDVNLPIVTAEQNNPNFTACLDRKA